MLVLKITKVKQWLILLTVGLFFVGCSKVTQATASNSQSIESTHSEAIHLIQRTGTFFEKGKMYGEKAKNDIQGQLRIWEQLCQDEIALSLDAVYAFINEKTGFLQAIQTYTPALLEEVKGIAAGAAVSEKHLLTLNLAEEIMILFSGGYESCTNIGLATETMNVLAYNLDLPDFLMQYRPVILKDETQFVYAFPGIIATGGMNRHFAVTTNSLSNLLMDTRGLPLPFMIRKLLTFDDETAAITFLKNTPLAAPQNIMIVGKNGVFDFECSAHQKIQYRNPKHPQVTYHTNHAIVNTDYNLAIERDTLVCKRFSYLDRLFDAATLPHSSLSEKILEEAINHTESTIRYDGNYFSYLATFPKHPDAVPILQILVPKVSNEMQQLTF
ncbi:MAG: C45 family peptidase [Bacteroidota bacterium]